MTKNTLPLALLLLLGSISASAATTVSGSGTLEHWVFEQKDGQAVNTGSELLKFSPHYAYAYDETTDIGKLRWVILSDKPVPRAAWLNFKNAGKPALAWCKEQSGSFVALRLGEKGENGVVECAADGVPKSKSTSVMNGVASIQPSLAVNDDKRVQGHLVIGEPACSATGSNEVKWELCTITGDYQFDTLVTSAD